MARRSRRLKREGGPQFSGPSGRPLPLAHESVRQALLGPGDRSAPLWRVPGPIAAVNLPRARAREALPRFRQFVSLAKPGVARLSLRGYSALRKLVMRAPARVRFCVQRSQRREVLFAYRKAGFAGSGPGRRYGFRRSYRRSASSGYSC